MPTVDLSPPDSPESQSAFETLQGNTKPHWSIRRTIWVAIGVSVFLWAAIIVGFSLISN
jgi:hypothetical protein